MAAMKKNVTSEPLNNLICRATGIRPSSGKAKCVAALACRCTSAVFLPGSANFGKANLNAMYLLPSREFLDTYLQKIRLTQQVSHIQLVPQIPPLIAVADLPLNLVLLPCTRITRPQHAIHQQRRIECVTFGNQQNAIGGRS